MVYPVELFTKVLFSRTIQRLFPSRHTSLNWHHFKTVLFSWFTYILETLFQNSTVFLVSRNGISFSKDRFKTVLFSWFSQVVYPVKLYTKVAFSRTIQRLFPSKFKILLSLFQNNAVLYTTIFHYEIYSGPTGGLVSLQGVLVSLQGVLVSL